MDTGSICISAPRRETDGRKRVFGRVPVPPENSVRGSQRPIGSFGWSPPARRPNLRFGGRTLFLRSAFAKPDTRVPVCCFRPRTKKWPRKPKSAFLCPHSAFLTRGVGGADYLPIFAFKRPEYAEATGRANRDLRRRNDRAPVSELPALSLPDPPDDDRGVRRGDRPLRADPVRAGRADHGARDGLLPLCRTSRHRAGTQGSVRDDMGRRLAVRAAVFRRSPAFYPCAGPDHGLCRASVVHPADGGHHRARRRDGHPVRSTAAARTRETFRRAETAVGRRQFGAYRLFLFGAPRLGKPRIGRRHVRPGIRRRLRTGGQPIGQRGRMGGPVSLLSRRTAAHTAQAVARSPERPTSSSTGR